VPRRGPARSWWHLALLIVVLAGAGRVAYVVAVTQHQPMPAQPRPAPTIRSYDEQWYESVARRVADGVGFQHRSIGGELVETAKHPPFTVLALVPAAAVSEGTLWMRLTVALAGTGVVVMTGVLARRLAGDRAGLIALGIAAVHPYLWMNDGLVMGETFASFWTLAASLTTVTLLRRPGPVLALGAGLATGLGALSRSELILLLPLLVLAVARGAPVDLGRRAVLCLMVLVGTSLPVGAWAAHNAGRFEERVVLTTNEGDALAGANCSETYAGPHLGYHYGFCGSDIDPPGDESVVAAERRAAALEFVGDNLHRLPVVVAARVARVVGVFEPFPMARDLQSEGRPLGLSHAGWALGLLLTPLAAAGAVLLRRRDPHLPVLAPILVVLATAALSHGQPRFRAPGEPLLIVLAAIGIALLRAPATMEGSRVGARVAKGNWL
jgi:4-amino-4-deoxy-L-arabinose transferase-like glycosyltransferase